MSCVIGIENGGKIYIGGDSCAITEDEYTIRIVRDPKVFKNKSIIVGFCGSFRAGYGLNSNYWTPPAKAKSIEQIVEHARSQLLSLGTVSNQEGVESCEVNCLLGWENSIYEMQADFHVGRSAESYTAIGAGRYYALGSLYETEGLDLSPEERITRALECASHFCAAVKPPYIIESK